MIRRVAITLLAVIIAAFRVGLRRRRGIAPAPVPAPLPPHVNLGDAVRMLPVECQNEAEAVRDFQAQWLRDQLLITADSVLATVQDVRASITHAGAEEARRALDELEQQAKSHPEGVPGYLVAAGRVRFDELMRRNIQ